MFELNRTTKKVFHFKKTAMPEIEKLSSWVRQMVWAGISLNGKTRIYFVNGWVNNQKYTNLLKEARRDILSLFPDEFFFVQDNARPHVHYRSMKYIRRWLTHQIKDHQAQSPDLNLIEVVWSRLKNMVELQRPRNKQELREAITRCWDEIPMSFIRNCIRGLPNKMQKAIDDANVKLFVDESLSTENDLLFDFSFSYYLFI